MIRRLRVDNAHEERARADDLAFIREVREASDKDLERLRLNLSYGAPEWQQVAVRREMVRRMTT